MWDVRDVFIVIGSPQTCMPGTGPSVYTRNQAIALRNFIVPYSTGSGDLDNNTPFAWGRCSTHPFAYSRPCGCRALRQRRATRSPRRPCTWSLAWGCCATVGPLRTPGFAPVVLRAGVTPLNRHVVYVACAARVRGRYETWLLAWGCCATWPFAYSQPCACPASRQRRATRSPRRPRSLCACEVVVA